MSSYKTLLVIGLVLLGLGLLNVQAADAHWGYRAYPGYYAAYYPAPVYYPRTAYYAAPAYYPPAYYPPAVNVVAPGVGVSVVAPVRVRAGYYWGPRVVAPWPVW